ncbi:MAG: Ig-like domain-containing protein, partial [Janthinobacterium lividum]
DSYSIMGFGAQITNALRAMVFTPAENRVAAGLAETTRFTLTATDQIQPTTDSVTTVRSKSINDAPVINGVQAAQASSDKLAISPFANVTFTDADRPGQTLDIVVKLGRSDVGTLANLGAFTYDTASQSYLYSGTAAQASLLVQAIRFVPINNRAAPGQVDNTVLTLSASDRLAARMIATTTIAITSEDDAPTIAGITTAAQAVRSGGAINPFATVAIGDADDPAQILTVHVTLSERANGVLSQLGAGQYNSATGDYVLYATAADATATLQGLVFTATPGQLAPVASASTRFSLNVDDNTFSQSNQDTVVVATGQNTPPVITGSSGAQDIDDDTSVHPFASLVISDADVPVQMLTASVTLDHPGQGSLRGFTRGAFDQSTGVYSVSGLASDVSAALQELEFVPQPNRLAPGSTETTVLRIDLSDGYQAVVDASTSVRSRSVNDAPTISGMPGMQDISDKQTLHPFANVAIDDADGAFQTLSVTVKLDHAVLGELSTTGDGHYDSASGLYHVSGSAAQVTAALQALTLTPTQNRMAPGASEPALLTLSVNDGTDATTLSSVVSITSVDDAPVATPLTINGASSTAGVVALDLHATDVDDAVVSFTLAGLPGGGTLFADADGTVAVVAGSGMTALNGGLRLYFKPQTGFGGTTQFSYVATDLAGNSSTMQAVVQLILIVPPPPATASAPEPVAAQSPVAPQAAAAPVVQLANGAAVSAASLARNVAGTSEGAAATPSSSTATLVTVGAQMPMQMVPQVDAAGAAVQVTLEGRSAAAAQAGYERVIEDNAASNVTIRGIAASSNVPIVLAPLALQPSANASLNLLDTQASAQTRAAVDSSTEAPEMIGSLDNLRKSAQLSSVQQEQIVESTVAASTAVTVGYVLWLLRGGVLAASMLTALPAWRFVDPLPVLGGLKNDDDAADDDSLEKLVAEGGETGEGGGLPCNPHGNFDGDLHGSDAGDADPVAKPGPYGHGSEIAMRTT